MSGVKFSQRLCVDQAHTASISGVKFHPSGGLLASCSADNTVKVWHGTTGSPLATLQGHTQGVSDVAWTPDGSYLASASDDTTIRVWDAATGAPACAPLRGHANFVFSLSFCPRTNLLASGSFDESLRLWDLRTGQCVRAIPAHSEPITSMAFNGDGSLIATGSYDGLVRLWDVGGFGQCLKTIQEEGVPPVSCVRWSPNGRYLLSAALDGTVRLWDPITSRRMRSLRGHANTRFCASAVFLNGGGGLPAAKPKRQLVACGGEEGKVTVWEVGSKEVVQELGGHSELVLALDAHPSRDVLVSGGSSLGNATSGSGAVVGKVEGGSGSGGSGSGGGGEGEGEGEVEGGEEKLQDFSLRWWCEEEL